jgi:protein TonB
MSFLDSPFVRTLAIAVIAHVGAWSASQRMDTSHAHSELPTLSDLVEVTPPVHHEPAPEPPKVPEPVATTPPPRPKLHEPEPPPKIDPVTPPSDKIIRAATALVGAAAKVFTADNQDDSAPTIVSGNTDAPGYGLVAANGQGTTFDPRATAFGKQGSHGTSKKADAPVGFDHSRTASVIYGYAEECGFPPEADAAGIDHAVVHVDIEVGADGKATSVRVLDDPGHGFGRAARSCAMGRNYRSAHDRNGNGIAASLPSVAIRFTR